jgi:cytochrome c oxidase subunit 2
MPRDVSTEGYRMDNLIHFALICIGLLFVIMCVWMFYACFKHNRGHKAKYDSGDSKKHRMAKLGVAAAIFFGVDGTLFYNSTVDLETTLWNFEKVDQAPDVVRIELNAHQWAWDFRYAGTDGKFGTDDDIVSLNDLRVPIDQPVLFQIGSTDVLHSLYIPNMRVKQDAVPGMRTRAWFQAKETGVFDIACAQHCGVNHYKMKARLTILSKEEYAAWHKDASRNAQRAYDPADKDAHWAWEWR